MGVLGAGGLGRKQDQRYGGDTPPSYSEGLEATKGEEEQGSACQSRGAHLLQTPPPPPQLSFLGPPQAPCPVLLKSKDLSGELARDPQVE